MAHQLSLAPQISIWIPSIRSITMHNLLIVLLNQRFLVCRLQAAIFPKFKLPNIFKCCHMGRHIRWPPHALARYKIMPLISPIILHIALQCRIPAFFLLHHLSHYKLPFATYLPYTQCKAFCKQCHGGSSPLVNEQ